MNTQKRYLSILMIGFTIITTSCKKESSESQPESAPVTNANTALIKSGSNEYIIADVEGVSGLTKLNFQDVDSISFVRHYNHCSVTQPFTLLEVNKGNPYNKINFVFFSDTMCTRFSEPLAVGNYRTHGNIQGSVTMAYCNSTLSGTCASMVPATHWGESGDYFEITDIKTIGGTEYAIGKFAVCFVYGPSLGQKLWLKNGIFKIKT